MCGPWLRCQGRRWYWMRWAKGGKGRVEAVVRIEGVNVAGCVGGCGLWEGAGRGGWPNCPCSYLPRPLQSLQDELLVMTAGDSVAYLTDFGLDGPGLDRLATSLRGVTTLVCESQYRAADRELAQKNFHLTSVLAATLAKRAGVSRLVLFHLSDRYQPEEWRAMLAEARAVFPETSYPAHWGLGA